MVDQIPKRSLLLAQCVAKVTPGEMSMFAILESMASRSSHCLQLNVEISPWRATLVTAAK
jgi:hypothetical protein